MAYPLQWEWVSEDTDKTSYSPKLKSRICFNSLEIPSSTIVFRSVFMKADKKIPGKNPHEIYNLELKACH